MIHLPRTKEGLISILYWLSESQMERLRPYFPKSHGVPFVDNRRVLTGVIFINHNGLRWRDAPAEYGPHKTIYNSWKRRSDMGMLVRIITGLAAKAPDHTTISLDATYLKAHRTASRIAAKRGAWMFDRWH